MKSQYLFRTSIGFIISSFLYVQAAELRFYHGSLQSYTATALEDPLKLLSLFNKSRVSMFYAFGFNEKVDDYSAVPILTAYLKTNYTNVILLNWEKEAEEKVVVTSYFTSAVPNAIKVGKQYGMSLVTLIKNGISEDMIHLIGHSLGAQLTSYAATTVQSYNYNLSRVTGLDPAGPDFEGPNSRAGLNASNAKFVDVLHTNPGAYGISHSVGSVDFWPNCVQKLQPGCAIDDLCSHRRSYLIYSEAITSPNGFPAARATDCKEWKRSCDINPQIIYMGDSVDRNARGNFYFSTNSESPFAKGNAGLKSTL